MIAFDELPELDTIWIDCGVSSKEEVEALGVHVGCVITYPDEFMVLNVFCPNFLTFHFITRWRTCI